MEATAFKFIWLNISVLSDVMPLSLLSVYYILLGNLIILCFLQRSLTTPATSDQQHSSLHLCSRHPRLELKLSLHKSPGSPAPQWATSPLTSLPSPMGSPLQSAATSSPTYCWIVNKSACTQPLPHCPLLGSARHHRASTNRGSASSWILSHIYCNFGNIWSHVVRVF